MHINALESAICTQEIDGPLPHCAYLQIGGVCLRVTGGRSSDVAFEPGLDPFLCAAGPFDIGICVEWLPFLRDTGRNILFDSGTTWKVCEINSGQLQFDFGDPISANQPYKRLFIDKHYGHASLLMSAQYFDQIPYADPLGYPLDELLVMHRLTQEQAIELHGVGVVAPDGAGNLFIGHSGAGKSTTARLWTSLQEVKILSDDRIIVRESPARELRPGDDPTQIFMYGTPWHGDACFALPDRAPLQRIFVLEHGRGNVIRRLTKSQAVAELFARSFVPFHGHEYLDHALSFLEQVAGSIPCYRYQFEPDRCAVERIVGFRD